MPIKNAYFQNTSSAPDYEALKAQLSSLYGVTEMNIDSVTKGVLVSFDDSFTSDKQIEQRISDIGYKLSTDTRHP